MKIIECLAEIAIQGDKVLTFINCTRDRAVYEVIGFEDPKIVIIDYRSRGIQAINELLESGNLHGFAPLFNTPALITLQEEDNGDVLIELNEPPDNQPDTMLWIAIGIRDSIPVYEYVFEKIAPLMDDSFAFIGLLEIPNLEQEYSDFEAFHKRI